jgi:hypothetical protein
LESFWTSEFVILTPSVSRLSISGLKHRCATNGNGPLNDDAGTRVVRVPVRKLRGIELESADVTGDFPATFIPGPFDLPGVELE